MAAKNIEEYLNVAGSKSVTVLLWLLKNRDTENRIATTLDEIAADCEVTKVTVNTVFQRLYKKEFLVRIRNGVYELRNV